MCLHLEGLRESFQFLVHSENKLSSFCRRIRVYRVRMNEFMHLRKLPFMLF